MERRILRRLETAVSPPVARAVLRTACEVHRIDLGQVSPAQLEKLGRVTIQALMRFGIEQREAERCSRRIIALGQMVDSGSTLPPAVAVDESQTTIPVREEYDIVRARGEGKRLSSVLGFPAVVQVKIATAISELARNIVLYAGAGVVVIRALRHPRVGIEITARDSGPGIRDLEGILGGTYRSRRGLGAGLRGTKALMDEFELETGHSGTTVIIRKFLV